MYICINVMIWWTFDRREPVHPRLSYVQRAHWYVNFYDEDPLGKISNRMNNQT